MTSRNLIKQLTFHSLKLDLFLLVQYKQNNTETWRDTNPQVAHSNVILNSHIIVYTGSSISVSKSNYIQGLQLVCQSPVLSLP